MNHTRKLRKIHNKTRSRIKDNKTEKKEKIMRQCKNAKIQVFSSFEKELEKTKEYKNLKNLKSVDRELVKRFKQQYAPSKITPRNDFYTYINYRWLKNIRSELDNEQEKQKKTYYVQIDDYRIVQDKVYEELIDIVKTYIRDNDSKQAQLIKNVYESLINLNHSSLNKHVLSMIKDYEHCVKTNNMWKFLAIINSCEIINWGCPIQWTVVADEKNSNIFRNFIDLPQLSLYDYMLYLENSSIDSNANNRYKSSVKKKYLEYINQLFDAYLGKQHGLDANDVFDVECDILLAMECNSIKNDSDDNYNFVKKEDALKMYGFDWDQLTHYLGYKETPNFFICGNLSYLKCICELLNKNWNTQKWRAYWYYIHLRQFCRFDKEYMYIHYEFNNKFLEGQPVIFPIEKYPVFGLSLTFNTFLTNEYVRRNKNEYRIQYVRNMAADLITVFKRIIKRNTWLSPKTKKYALLKLDFIKLEIAQPKDLRYDPLINYTSDDAWENMKKICLWKTNKYINLEGKDIIDIPLFDWKDFKLIGKQAYIVNAFYTPSENSIYIPLAYLQKPFIDLEERGIEYNLANIGYTLCHEMSHALDDLGSKYDHNGNLHDWWTKEDKLKYNYIIKDIIKQYEVLASYDNIVFDAEISVGEDMADISGLAIAVEYLRDFQMFNSIIVPICSLSFQSFFVFFAFQQRQHVYKKAFNAQLKTNPHPMDKYRTNVPLSRLKIFRSLFNVKKGDNMWWHSTNTIW